MFSFMNALVLGSPMGRIYATTNKPYYVAGELVQGNIVCEAIAPLSAQGIDLKVSGYEKTEWHDQQHRTETITPAIPGVNGQPGTPAVTRQIPQMHRHRGKKQFFSQNIRVYNIGGGMLAPGTYTFPFQYQLPDGIPGSFHERTPMPNVQPGTEWIDHDQGDTFYDSDDDNADGGRSGMLAVVNYKLKVTLDVNGFFMKDMHARVPLVIHPKLAASLAPATQTLAQEIVVCCCIKKGTCTVCARFDKLAYVAGETANVRCDIDNQSTSNLKTRVILRRYLKLKSGSGKGKDLTEDIVQQSYDPVPGKTNSADRPMPLKLDGPKCKPSTTGSMVSCNYEYLVECAVSMGKDLNLKMPLTIYMPQPPPLAAAPFSPPPPVVVSPQAPIIMAVSPQPMQSPMMQQQQQPMMQQQQQQQFASPSGQYQQQPQQGQYQQPQGQQYQQQPQGQQYQQQQSYGSQQPMQQQQPNNGGWQ